MSGTIHVGDRRLRRHEETRETILALAVEIMATEGVGGLSLGELARRLGVRTPSLYTYFESKAAVYDELFRRGWSDASDDQAARAAALGPVDPDTDVVARASALMEAHVRWAIAHAEVAQLMMFRPVPGYEPSEGAFAASVEMFGLLVAEVEAYSASGLLRPDADLGALIENLTSAASGVIGRHLANEPGVPFEAGRATRHLGSLVEAVITPSLPLAS